MIRTAILGAGIGAEHLAGYRALPHLFDVTAICDLDTARACAIAGNVPVTADSASVLNDPAIDLIDICLPPHLHVPMTLEALAKGKHVICEKPIATSMAEIDQLEVAAKAASKRIFPVFQYRFGRAMDQLQALDATGLLGQPQTASLETHWARGADYYAIPWRGTWAGEQGGVIIGHAIHAHDLLCTLFGPVACVNAQLATRINPIETEDTVAISFRMQNGALATSSVTLGGADDTTRIKLIYQHLTATSGPEPYAPMDQDWVFQARDPARQGAVDAALDAVTAGPAGFAGFLQQVAGALNGVDNRAVTLADGRASMALITAIYASSRADGAPARLPVTVDHPLYEGWQPS